MSPPNENPRSTPNNIPFLRHAATQHSEIQHKSNQHRQYFLKIHKYLSIAKISDRMYVGGFTFTNHRRGTNTGMFNPTLPAYGSRIVKYFTGNAHSIPQAWL